MRKINVKWLNIKLSTPIIDQLMKHSEVLKSKSSAEFAMFVFLTIKGICTLTINLDLSDKTLINRNNDSVGVI